MTSLENYIDAKKEEIINIVMAINHPRYLNTICSFANAIEGKYRQKYSDTYKKLKLSHRSE